MDVGNVLQLTHSFGYVQKGAGMEWTSRAELMTWHHWKSRWLDDLIPKKSPAFFCLNRHAAAGPELETAQQEEGVQFQMDTLRKLREAGFDDGEAYQGICEKAKKRDNSWVVKKLYMVWLV